MSLLDRQISVRPRSLIGPLLVAVAIMWVMGAGRWAPDKK